jgi:hypothetical protein
MDKCIVFYSWESDLPNSTNRSFIQKALEDAARSIRSDDSIKIDPVIDRDTSGVPGSPDIANTIFSKIDASDIFACDVSIINHGEKSRPTPNPNVLIELGYAVKALKSERIIMIMNTAFGGPELLPFDLSKKRVSTYCISKDDVDKSTERKKLTQLLVDAIKTIASHADKSRVKGKRSRDKANLKEECEYVLLNGNKLDWQGLVDELGRDIPNRILEWKPKGELAAHKGGEEWENAVLEVSEICLPAFVPILTAVDKGNKEFWRESISTLRRLSLLEERMGGGATWVLNIGAQMLYIAGSLGMAMAVQTKQIGFVNEWMLLPMPNPDSDQHEEIAWAEAFSAHHLPEGIEITYKEPFKLLLKVCESNYVSPFFPNREQLKEYLFLSNLLQSLVELRRCTEREDTRRTLEEKGSLSLDVWPVWCLMDSKKFKEGTWDLFGSSKGVLNFVFPDATTVTLDRFWPWWKNWKEICIGTIGDRPFLFREANWLTLPGEPMNIH